jgi:hypothetical protein
MVAKLEKTGKMTVYPLGESRGLFSFILKFVSKDATANKLASFQTGMPFC